MSKYTYIICGKFYNGIDAEFKEGYKILVKDNKIEAVGREIPQPETAEVVDLSDATVTPGMIDAHMHMDYIEWHTIREEVYTTSEEAKTIAIIRTAQKTLSRGFTTVRHPGGITSNGFGVLDVKRAIEKDKLLNELETNIKSGGRLVCINGYINEEGQMMVIYTIEHDEVREILKLEDQREIPTATSIYIGAAWFEEEIEEMMPVKFIGLKRSGRLFLPDEFKNGEGKILVLPLNELKKLKDS